MPQPPARKSGVFGFLADLFGGEKILLAAPDDDPDMQEIREELQAGEWRGAKFALSGLRDPHQREYTIESLADFQDRPPGFAAWVSAQPDNPDAYLLRAAHAIKWAWVARTSAAGSQVSRSGEEKFTRRLQSALSDLKRAAKMTPDDPTIGWQQLICARGLGMEEEVFRDCLAQTLALCPEHHGAHYQALQYFCAKWYGSHEKMFEFAHEASASAPEGSLVHAVMAWAHIERFLQQDDEADEIAEFEGRGYWDVSEVHRAITGAWRKSIGSSSHRENALTPRVRNVFAAALALVGEGAMASREFERIGDRPLPAPWQYFGSPTKVFRKMRKAAS